MGYDPTLDSSLCGVCLERRIDVDYYLCDIAHICKECLSLVLSKHTNFCPLCPPNKNCDFRVESYDATTYTGPSRS